MEDRRVLEFVTLSGVEFAVQELMGEHQRYLSEQRYKKGGAGIDLLLKECILRMGDKTKSEITSKDIDNLLGGDRKHILVTLRQFTLRYQKTFDFDFEWPVKGGGRQKQHYSVSFKPGDFPITPYGWVRESWENAIQETRELFDRQGKVFTDEDRAEVPIPKVYDSYADVLKHQEYDIILPRTKKKVRLKLLDGTAETASTKIIVEDRSTHTPLTIRKPRYIEYDEEKQGEREFIVILDKLFFEDITAIRQEIKRMEGDVDTTLVVENQQEPGETKSLNLLGIVDFFFPSVAI